MRFFSKFKTSDQYRKFTTKFDVEVHANNIATVLGPLGAEDEAAVEQGWHALQTGLLAWKTRLHLLAAESAARIRQKMPSEERADTAITLLFDQSGSMRGQRMLFAAATADIAQEFLVTLGFRCEILGFTTSRWKGGRSRQLWMRSFKPRNPGRLNDLLHIIYKSADDRRAGAGIWALRQMLRPDLPKENIDGEAVLWAFGRLFALPQSRKHLIVLTDGAPVDDSTWLENGPDYLLKHLEEVVRRIASVGDVSIAAMGIGYRTHDFYPISRHVEAPDDLGAALIDLLEDTVLNRAST